MWAEFKEKPFESAFLAELGRLTNIIFCPDQADEGLLGFDGSFFLPMPMHFYLFPYLRSRRWRRMIGMTAGEIDDFGAELDARLPDFHLNFFVQYKRPEWLHRSNATEWASWSKSYFRYTIEPKQQGLLEKALAASSGRAAVVYAAPAFWKSTDLFAHTKAGDVSTHSNIASAALLTGHERFTYTDPGHHGIAHSEPEAIDSPSIQTLLDGARDNNALPFTKQVKDAAALIGRILEGEQDDYRVWQAARDAIVGGDAYDILPRARGSWVDAVISMAAFSYAFDISITSVGIHKPDFEERDAV